MTGMDDIPNLNLSRNNDIIYCTVADSALDHPWLSRSTSLKNIDILPNIRANFDAKATLKKAVSKLTLIRAMQNHSEEFKET
jgi:hypothetical protein